MKRHLSLIVYYCPGYVDNKSIASLSFVSEIPILWDFLKRSFLSNNWLKGELINELFLSEIILDKFKISFKKPIKPRLVYLKGVGRRLVYHQLVYQKRRQVSQKIILSLPKIGKSLRRLHPKGTVESVLFYWRLKSENSLSHVTLNWLHEENLNSRR